jgi:hypothetical protein
LGKEVVMNPTHDELRVFTWNVKIKNRADRVRKAVCTFIKQHNPDVVVLIEASKLYGELEEFEKLGWKILQLKPRPLKKGNEPAQGNIALLVAPDFSVKGKETLRMEKFWTGPVHGWPQDPRVFRSVDVRRKGDKTARTWSVLGAHIPFGEDARRESTSRIVQWFKARPSQRPALVTLDANMGIRPFEITVAEPAKAHASGFRIDLQANVNCELVDEDNLGEGISDHPAVMRVYRAKRRNS